MIETGDGMVQSPLCDMGWDKRYANNAVGIVGIPLSDGEIDKKKRKTRGEAPVRPTKTMRDKYCITSQKEQKRSTSKNKDRNPSKCSATVSAALTSVKSLVVDPATMTH